MTTGFFTQTQLVNMKLLSDSGRLESSRIADLIKTDLQSPAKLHMAESVRYYDGEHDILNRVRFYWRDHLKVEDQTKANNKISHVFHKLLVDQKAAYIVGNPVVVSVARPEVVDPKKPTPEEESEIEMARAFEADVLDMIGNDFDDKVYQLVTNSSKKSVEWVHFYISEAEGEKPGTLKKLIVPGEQIIPIYDSMYQEVLVGVIRYYTYELVDENTNKVQTLYKVEWWTKTDVTFYVQRSDEAYILDPDVSVNPRPHWFGFMSNTPDERQPNNWGRVPFVPLYNNDDRVSDLKPIKLLIDSYDKVKCDWANDLEDFQEILYVLKGYEGISGEAKKGYSELGMLVENIKAHKIVTTSGEGGLDTVNAEIPVEAKEKFLKITRDEIYAFGQGVNPDHEKFGDPSGVALKFLYGLLDMKANRTIRKLKAALTECMWFICEHINRQQNKEYDYTEVTITVNKSQIFNEKEKIEEASLSKGIISDKTIMEHHPWVDDPEQEQGRLDAQEQDKIEKGMVQLGNVDPNQPDLNDPNNKDAQPQP